LNSPNRSAEKTYLVTGAAGMLGRAFVEALTSDPSPKRVLAVARRELDVVDREAILALEATQPDVIIHCAADVNAERCEVNPVACHEIQVVGTMNVAALAKRTGATVLYPQSFLIFDGQSPGLIDEQTQPRPLSVYGRCKLEAERRLLETCPDALVVRMGGFFGGDERDKNFVGKFVHHALQLIDSGSSSCDVGDRVWQPTYTLDLARNCLLLLEHDKRGIYHMASIGEATFYDVACACLEDLNLTHRLVARQVSAELVSGREKALRPARAILSNQRLLDEGLYRQRPWRDALREYLARPYFMRLLGDPIATHDTTSAI
jgi:dTDP-4-dehydrorhamnose reductase